MSKSTSREGGLEAGEKRRRARAAMNRRTDAVRPDREAQEKQHATSLPKAPPRQGAGRERAPENSIRPVPWASSPKIPPTATPARGADPPSGTGEDRPDNAIPATERAATDRQTTPESTHPVPEAIRQRFVQVGKHYHFMDGTRAFTDRGTRLTTPSENTEVIRSLISIAQARGWQQISVRGTERFRREAWFAARLAGIEVRGHRPSEFERAHLARTVARSQREQSQQDPGADLFGSEAYPGTAPREAGRERQSERARARGALLIGKLVDHGRATYQHDPRQPMSYFVRLETTNGDRTIWGVDLERAVKESLTQPKVGDEVGLRAVRREAVQVRTRARGADGKRIEKDLATHRNRWVLERREFFEARAAAARTLRDGTIDAKQAVKRHPELVGTYHQVRAAELTARRFPDPQEGERFVAQVRSTLANAVARGEPLPPVRLRERASARDRPRSRGTPERETAPVRG